jgi:hypothetical protein
MYGVGEAGYTLSDKLIILYPDDGSNVPRDES